ncbi:MAG: class I SAM-dependent methyltransferase [Verrucomicrobiota bacterium]
MPSETVNAEIEAFFDGWEIYRRVIECNFMSHRELGDALIAHFAERGADGSILDLGCGDSALSSRVVRDSGFSEYHGVDLASMALKFAEDNLQGAAESINLHHSDLGDFVRSTERQFDAVIVGYSLHHYPKKEKAGFLKAIVDRQLLKADGELLIYDIFRDPGVTREQYLESYLAMCKAEWLGYDERQWEGIVDHISTRDYPEVQSEFIQLGHDAGLYGGAELWRDQTGFHRLIQFTAL